MAIGKPPTPGRPHRQRQRYVAPILRLGRQPRPRDRFPVPGRDNDTAYSSPDSDPQTDRRAHRCAGGPAAPAGTFEGSARSTIFSHGGPQAIADGTAPVGVSSGGKKIHQLSLRGNRRPGHAIHMAAVTQIRYKHSPGRGYFDRKIAEGKTGKEALRALKRRVSDAIYRQLQADARTAAARSGAAGPGGQPGNGSASSAAGSHPARRLFGPATPEPAPSVRPRRRRPVPAPPAARAHASDRTGQQRGFRSVLFEQAG